MKRAALLVAGLISLFLLKSTILEAVGNWLINTHEQHKCDAIFVLAGGPVERGEYAAILYKQGISKQLVCTGELVFESTEILCGSFPESYITRKVLTKSGVDSSHISLLKEGTSTKEEADAILTHALQKGWKHIAIVSSIHHTRRVDLSVQRRAHLMGIRCDILGAPPKEYAPHLWYKSEHGLLFVFNEYLKMAYYLYKY